MKILFFCVGNTCRSPMAEIIFKNMAQKGGKDWVIESAGTFANEGRPMLDDARAALAECGEQLPGTLPVGRQFRMSMYREYDRVVDCRFFPDPVGQGLDAYIDVCKQLQSSLAALYNEICKTSL